MRLPAGLWLFAASAVVAAPQKEDLPPGAVGRLAGPASPGKGEVTALLYLNEHTLFVGTSAGWTTWDLRKRTPRQARPVGGPTAAAAHDGGRLFVGSARKLHVIEPLESATAEPARSWDSAADLVSVVAVDRGGRRVVFADGERKLTVLDPATGKATGAVELPARPVAAALAANGRVLAVVTVGGAARVYALAASGAIEPLWLKRVARTDRASVQFSPDGRLVALSSAGRVAVFESVTGRQFASLDRKFGEADVRAFAFSPDGRRIAAVSGGSEAVVRVWAVETGQELASYTGHGGDVNAVAFAPDGKSVASAGPDQTVLFWRAPAAPDGDKVPAVKEAWEALDALEAASAYRAVGGMLADPRGAVIAVRGGFRGQAAEEAKLRRWIAELDHDEFRVREAARRGLIKAGLRAAAAIKDPARKRLGTEGEERIRSILDEFDEHGLRVPEAGLYGEPLRLVRGIRVLEAIGGADARAVLEEMGRGAKDERVAKEARAALAALPAGR